MHGIQEDMGRGQVPFKSPQGSKLKRDLLFQDNIRYAKNMSKNASFHRSAHAHFELLPCYVQNYKFLP